MNRVLLVAWREFMSVVMTKIFIFGLVFPPVLGFFVSYVMTAAQNSGGPSISGRVVIVDHSGAASDRVAYWMSSKGEDEERDQAATSGAEQAKAMGITPDAATPLAKQLAQQTVKMGSTGSLAVSTAAAGTTAEQLTKEMERSNAGPADSSDPSRLIAVIEIPKDSVFPNDKGQYSSLTVFGVKGLDIQVQQRIARAAGNAVVDARVATDKRIKDTGLDRGTLSGIMTPPRATTRDVDATGVQKSTAVLDAIIPIAFMILLFVSVIISGQSLMTAVVEEKSSRVMELLLSAVSPMQLMTGKILGQMMVGLLVMVVYATAGMAVLAVFSMISALPMYKLGFLLIYYIIAYLTIASLLAAVGSAVNEMREAQALQSPVIMLLMVAFYGSFYVQRQPNSTISVVASFLPITSPFTMVSRLGGSEPIPMWHVPASIVVGILTVLACLWLAGKVFRVGVLMYGKPPNFATLIRWIRMA